MGRLAPRKTAFVVRETHCERIVQALRPWMSSGWLFLAACAPAGPAFTSPVERSSTGERARAWIRCTGRSKSRPRDSVSDAEPRPSRERSSSSRAPAASDVLRSPTHSIRASRSREARSLDREDGTGSRDRVVGSRRLRGRRRSSPILSCKRSSNPSRAIPGV